ncbi:MAG: hypothetical protein JO015_15200 [Verrucomicrobia bacterium]|nr:hypothetical protein [Verrucomicrobiota bacterium]
MDTITYASVTALSWSIVKSSKRPLVPEVEFVPLKLTYLVNRSWLRLFQTTGPCNDL